MDVTKPYDLLLTVILDTSGSMNGKFSHQLTKFESAKTAIRLMVKNLNDLFSNQNVQVTLFTYQQKEGTTFAFQSKQSSDPGLNQFIERLSQLKAYDLFNGERAIQDAYEYLHLVRMVYNSDALGEGRKPWNGKRNIICWFTDGESMITTEGINTTFNPAPVKTPGHQYFQADHRWDQKLFIYYLSPKERPIPSFIKRFASQRGGMIFHNWNMYEMRLQIEAQMPAKNKVRGPENFNDYGIIVNFYEEGVKDKSGANPMVKLSFCTGNNRPVIFPLPEGYFTKSDVPTLPPRETFPKIFYERGDKFFTLPKDYPCDEYLIAPCSLTQELLSQPTPPCWPVNIPDSYITPGKGFAFGYLTCNKSQNEAKLVVLGYNFKTIFWLIDQYYSTYHGQLATPYVSEATKYFENTPFYYHKAVMTILINYGINTMDYSRFQHDHSLVMKNLQANIKEAKEELQRKGYDQFLMKQHEPGKNLLTLDLFQLSRSELLTSLHQLKHHFFQCGSKEDPNGLKEVLPANQREIPIDKMGDYSTRQRQSLKNPMDSEEDILYKEKVQFGNPFANREEILAGKVVSSHIDQAGQTASSRGGKLVKHKAPRRRSISPAHFRPHKVPKLRAISALSDTEDDGEDLSEDDVTAPPSPRNPPTRVRISTMPAPTDPTGPPHRPPATTGKPSHTQSHPTDSVPPPPPPPKPHTKSVPSLPSIRQLTTTTPPPVSPPAFPRPSASVASQLPSTSSLPTVPPPPPPSGPPPPRSAKPISTITVPPTLPSSSARSPTTTSTEKPPSLAQIKSQLVQSIQKDDEPTILHHLHRIATDTRYPPLKLASLFKNLTHNSKVARKRQVTDYLESTVTRLLNEPRVG